MRRLLLAILAAGLLGAPAPARADGVKVAVAPFAPLTGDVPVKAGAKAAMLLAGELKNVGTIAPVEIALEPNEAAAAGLKAAREAINVAQAAEKRRKFGIAAAAYRKAIASYDAGAAQLTDPAELSDAHVALGTVLYLTGDDAGGAKELWNAVSLTPTRPFQGEATSPLFTATVKKIREQVLAAPKATLRVESLPPGAHVLLDGQDVGKTPLSLKDIPPGKHLWQVLLPTSEAIGGTVVLKEGAREKIVAAHGGTAPISLLVAGLVANKLEEKTLAAAKATAAAAGADLLAFGAFFAREQELILEVFLYSPAKDALVRLPPKTFDAEMLSAGMELFKVAGDISARVEDLGAAEKLPARVSLEAPPPSAASLTEVAYALPGEKSDKPEETKGPRRPVDPTKGYKNIRQREK